MHVLRKSSKYEINQSINTSIKYGKHGNAIQRIQLIKYNALNAMQNECIKCYAYNTMQNTMHEI